MKPLTNAVGLIVHDLCLGVVELRSGSLRIRIDEGLLVYTTHSLNDAHVKGVLTAKIARVFGLNFTMRDVIVLLFL